MTALAAAATSENAADSPAPRLCSTPAGRRELDILFDFSASPVGGGLKRLLAFADHFARQPERVLFLVHPLAEPHVAARGVPYQVLRRGPVHRILCDRSFVESFAGRARWFFSYGIPMYRKVGDQNWLHVSNALPFGLFGLTLEARGFFGNFLLRERFIASVDNCTVVSGESHFTLDLFRRTTGWGRRLCLLPNGLDQLPSCDFDPEARLPRAIAVGTSPYKRLDRTCAVFERLRARLGLRELMLVGSARTIPRRVAAQPYVHVAGTLTPAQVWDEMARSRVFISTSEIENSSNAVLEACNLCPTVVLSDIPSHRELLVGEPKECLRAGETSCIVVTRQASLPPSADHDWGHIIRGMLRQMGETGS